MSSQRERWAAEIARDFPTLPHSVIDMMLEFHERDPKAMRDLAAWHRRSKPQKEDATRKTCCAAAEMRVLSADEVDALERRRAEALAKSFTPTTVSTVSEA